MNDWQMLQDMSQPALIHWLILSLWYSGPSHGDHLRIKATSALSHFPAVPQTAFSMLEVVFEIRLPPNIRSV